MLLKINLMLTILAGTLSGMLAAMGLGGGSILIIYLTLFAGVEQGTAQGINLIFFIPSALTALFYYMKEKIIEVKIVLIASALGILGGLLGAYFSSIVSGYVLSKLFGILLLLMGINQLIAKKIN